MYGNSKSNPSEVGVQSGICTPFGTDRNAIRIGLVGATESPMAANAGRMASSSGRAIAVLSPRNTVRREIARSVISRLRVHFETETDRCVQSLTQGWRIGSRGARAQIGRASCRGSV